MVPVLQGSVLWRLVSRRLALRALSAQGRLTRGWTLPAPATRERVRRRV